MYNIRITKTLGIFYNDRRTLRQNNDTGMKFGKHISTDFRSNYFSVVNYFAKLIASSQSRIPNNN